MFGKLTWAAIPIDEPIAMVGSGAMVLVILGLLAWITWRGLWPYLWREWITSVDHKRIGVMYCLLALIMLLRGFSDAMHDAIATRDGDSLQAERKDFCLPNTTIRYFSAHGTIMIFFMAMPFMCSD